MHTVQIAVTRCFVGTLSVGAGPRGVCAVGLGEATDFRRELARSFPGLRLLPADPAFEAFAVELARSVNDGAPLPQWKLDLRGSDFQLRVWRALRTLGSGTTTTYAELARTIGAPGAARAVGTACARNALALVVPCHRVLRSDGALGGYRWGVERKRRLLEREIKGARYTVVER